MANSRPHLQEVFYKPAKSFVEVSQMDNQKIPEGRASEFLCHQTVLNLSLIHI